LLPVVAFLDNALFDDCDVTATKLQAKVRSLVKDFSSKMEQHGNSSGSDWGPLELLLKKIVDFTRTKKEKAAELKASTAELKEKHLQMELGCGMAASLADPSSVEVGEALAQAQHDEEHAIFPEEALEAQERGAALTAGLAASRDFAGGGGGGASDSPTPLESLSFASPPTRKRGSASVPLSGRRNAGSDIHGDNQLEKMASALGEASAARALAAQEVRDREAEERRLDRAAAQEGSAARALAAQEVRDREAEERRLDRAEREDERRANAEERRLDRAAQATRDEQSANLMRALMQQLVRPPPQPPGT